MFRWQIEKDIELRLLELEHAAALFALVDKNRAMLKEWLPWLDTNKSVDDSRAFIRSCMESHAANKGFAAGIWVRNELAGVISYHPIHWANKKVSLGYWVSQEHQGKGLAKKAARAMTQYAFETLNLNRVEIFCATGNVKSQKIPRALGFQEEGVQRQAEWLYDRFVDHVGFAMLRKDWDSK